MTTSRRRATRALGTLLGLTLLAAIAPASTGAAPSHTVRVGSSRDFVPQANFVQCVGASMQMMLNMIGPGRDDSPRTQLRLQRLARVWSGPRPGGGERQGASVRGWASGLNIMGAGPYRLVGTTTLRQALKVAARALASTGRPVGLLVWRGRHAWVMSGFTATADPLETDDFRVTRAIVHDPLYPHGSEAWGPSPRPGEAITPAVLGRQFVPRRMSTRWLDIPGFQPSTLGGKYVLVLPFEIDPARETAFR